MKNLILSISTLVLLTAGISTSWADKVNFDLSGIAAGQPARAADVTNAFNAVKDAIDSCPADMVKAGPICVDMYEASLWDAPTGGAQTNAGACSGHGNDCNNIYARSVAGVIPVGNVTWFQAQQACANVGKRLPTNAEWQLAAAGTTDPNPGAVMVDATMACNVNTGVAVNTGLAGTNCQSRWGARDMIGNLNEWVADWMSGSGGVPVAGNNGADFGLDEVRGINAAGNSTGGAQFPSAIYRGGAYGAGNSGGVFTLVGAEMPNFANPVVGFRCVY